MGNMDLFLQRTNGTRKDSFNRLQCSKLLSIYNARICMVAGNTYVNPASFCGSRLYLFMSKVSEKHRLFQDGMNIGLQTKYTMEIWLCFKVKKKCFCHNQWMVPRMSTSSIRNLRLHQRKRIGLYWRLEIGLEDMGIVNLSGLAMRIHSHCPPLIFPNARYLIRKYRSKKYH